MDFGKLKQILKKLTNTEEIKIYAKEETEPIVQSENKKTNKQKS